jgi:hypothetical protein
VVIATLYYTLVSMLAAMLIFMFAIMSVSFVTFIFIIESRPGLSLMSLKLFYDGTKILLIASIYNIFVKSL